MDLKLELVLIPVSDVDRAKAFYVETVGFNLDVDHEPNDEFRVVQMTPPGSACSITIGRGITEAAPGSVRGTHLIVSDIEAARARARRAGSGGRRDSAHDGGRLEAWSGSRAPRLQLVRGLQRSRREHLGPAGGQGRGKPAT